MVTEEMMYCTKCARAVTKDFALYRYSCPECGSDRYDATAPQINILSQSISKRIQERNDAMAHCRHCGRSVTKEFAERRYSCPECGEFEYIMGSSTSDVSVSTLHAPIDRADKEKHWMESTPHGLKIHSDLEGLLWFLDGPLKNHEPYEEKSTIHHDGFDIVLTWRTLVEPSAVSMHLPITEPENIQTVRALSYYPRYDGLTPEQRWMYWRVLANPYIECDIGYVFLLYYGLERHLVSGEFDRAFEIILKLRGIHKHKSFQGYSLRSLLYSCMIHNRPDLLRRLSNSIDGDEMVKDFFCFAVLKKKKQEDIFANELMHHARFFGFENTRYIKMHPQMFEKYLTEYLAIEYGVAALPIDLLDFAAMTLEKTTFFANTSFGDRTVSVPEVSSCETFIKAGYEALYMTHQNVKVQHIKPIKQKVDKKSIPIVEYSVPDISQYTNMTSHEKYYAALQALYSIKKTGMTRSGFAAYAVYGEIMLGCLKELVIQWREDDKRIGLEPQAIPSAFCAIELPDMYMRWGQWDDAARVFDACLDAGGLTAEDHRLRIADLEEKENAVSAITAILKNNDLPMKQNSLKKHLFGIRPDGINWALRFYKGFYRVKEDSTYLVSLVEF